MLLKTINGLSYYQFESLSKIPGLHHFTTTRHGGRSKAPYDTLNFGTTSDEKIDKNLNLLNLAIRKEKTPFVIPKQTHSCNVFRVDKQYINSPVTIEDTDALITHLPHFWIAVKTADCVPLLLYDPVQKVIAAIHSGWKGTAMKIAAETVHQMQKYYDSEAKDIIACVGPSIGPEVYEVGEEVLVEFQKEFKNPLLFMNRISEKKYLLDLWKAHEIILNECGVMPQNIEFAQICTFTQNQNFFSARKNKGQTGRMLTGIMLE